jgi:hypothetical protein
MEIKTDDTTYTVTRNRQKYDEEKKEWVDLTEEDLEEERKANEVKI